MTGNVFLAAALLSAIFVTFFATQMMGELNRQLPKNQQFNFWNARGRVFMLGRQHKLHYPVSNKRLVYNGLLVLTLAFICIGMYLHFH